MKFLLAVFAAFFLALPTYALDVDMGFNGGLVFEPSEITIDAGDTVHFVNQMLPPHNIIVDSRPDLSRESLMFSPGESQDVKFTDPGDYKFWCGPHKGAGMEGVIHVR